MVIVFSRGFLMDMSVFYNVRWNDRAKRFDIKHYGFHTFVPSRKTFFCLCSFRASETKGIVVFRCTKPLCTGSLFL